ncbi:MAG: hypothetical protein U0T75_13530 [Chitinophagales bacterium]
MENQETNLSHAQSMQIIQSMIAQAKNKISDDGFHFLLWGVLVIAASLGQYYMALHEMVNNFWPWMVMPLVGMPAAFFYEWRKSKAERVKTYVDIVFGYLWAGIGVALFLVIFFSVRAEQSPIPYVLLLAGLGTFVSGTALKAKSLIAGGMILWLGAIGADFVSPLNQLLINAAATFMGYIIPGLILRRAAKAEEHV